MAMTYMTDYHIKLNVIDSSWTYVHTVLCSTTKIRGCVVGYAQYYTVSILVVLMQVELAYSGVATRYTIR
jgi:hypothetical protein